MTVARIDWAACLHTPVADPTTLLLSDGLFNLSAAMLVVAVMVAAPLAWWTRRRYRLRVTRLMGLEQVVPAPGATGVAAAAAAAANAMPAATAAPAVADAADDAAARMRRVTRATLLAWLGFGALGVAVAGVAGAQTWAQRIGLGIGAALLALGPVMTNLPPRWARRAHLAGAVAGLAAIVLMAALDDGPPDPQPDPWWQTALTAAAVALAYALMFHRRLRGQVQPLAVLLAVGLFAVVLPYALIEWNTGTCMAEVAALPDGAPEGAMSLLGFTALLLAGLWLGFRALTGLVRLIERGWLSELSLGCALCLLLIAVALVFAMAPEARHEVRAAHLVAPLLWAAGSFALYALALGPALPAGPAPQLLVLRVFSDDARRHDLLDGLQARWRYLGPVHQIGGPDMVAMNVDPYEAAMFLASRLHELFLPAALDTAQLQARLDARPDRDGRYRINEVFCFNSAWRRTVEQLMQLSDAIVLDLRGLTAQREGTSFEIARLAALGRLDRVLALGDAATDWAHVDALLQRHGADGRQLPRLQADAAGHGEAAAEALFRQLVQAVTTSAARQAPGPAMRPEAA
jgi:hypothetical protein